MFSHQNSNTTIHFRTQLQSKSELPILKPVSKPSFLASYQISYDERLKLRNINKKMISNDDQKKGVKAQKIEDIKLYVQREIDKKNPSKHFLVSQLLNQKPALRQPELRNIKINKSGTKTKNVGNGSTTILINKVENKNNYLEKIINMQPDSSYLLRLALKWKNMRWLLEHKKDQVQKIILSYKEMNWFLNSRGIKLKKDIFFELMGLLRLKDDKEFCDNIFYMFDEDRDNIIDYKELVLGLKFSSSDSYASKITLMIEVCSQEKFVDLEEFGRVLSMTIYNKKEFKAICNIVNRYIYENKIRDLSKHSKEKLLDFALKDEKFQRIVKRNIDNISEMENHYEDEINYNCVFNLKKSKLNNYDETGVIPIEYERLENLLQIRDDCIVEKKVNLNRGFTSKENSSEEEGA